MSMTAWSTAGRDPSSVPRRLLAYHGGCSATALAPAGAYEPRLVGEHHELRPVAGVELGHGPAHMGLGRRRAQPQPLGDLVVGEAGADEGHDFAFPVGEQGELRGAEWVTGPPGVLLDEASRHSRREQG